jgi:small basic protein
MSACSPTLHSSQPFKPAVLEALDKLTNFLRAMLDKLFKSDTVNSYAQFVLSKSLLSQETIADSI